MAASDRTLVTSASLPDLFSRNMDICSTFIFHQIQQTWIQRLSQLMQENNTVRTMGSNKTSFAGNFQYMIE
jgi:hypothetical protein